MESKNFPNKNLFRKSFGDDARLLSCNLEAAYGSEMIGNTGKCRTLMYNTNHDAIKVTVCKQLAVCMPRLGLEWYIRWSDKCDISEHILGSTTSTESSRINQNIGI